MATSRVPVTVKGSMLILRFNRLNLSFAWFGLKSAIRLRYWFGCTIYPHVLVKSRFGVRKWDGKRDWFVFSHFDARRPSVMTS